MLAGATLACSEDDTGERTLIPQRRGEKGESCRARNDCRDGLACVRDVCVVDEFDIAPSARSCDVIQCNDVSDCLHIAEGCEELQVACTRGNTAACESFERACNFACETNRCEPRCVDDALCPPGWTCRDGQCSECAGNGDCDAGERCLRGRCIEPCRTDLDCPLFHTCRDGECLDTGCTADRECVALLRNVDAQCIEGRCTAPCQADTDCDDPDDYGFNKCVDQRCQHVGCESAGECRARLYGDAPVPDGVLEVVCREAEPNETPLSVPPPSPPVPDCEGGQ